MKDINDEKIEKLEKETKKEFKKYASDVKGAKLDFFDKYPFIQKVVFLAAGIKSFVIGFALYFFIKDDKKRWESDYLLIGSVIGLVICFIEVATRIINAIKF